MASITIIIQRPSPAAVITFPHRPIPDEQALADPKLIDHISGDRPQAFYLGTLPDGGLKFLTDRTSTTPNHTVDTIEIQASIAYGLNELFVKYFDSRIQALWLPDQTNLDNAENVTPKLWDLIPNLFLRPRPIDEDGGAEDEDMQKRLKWIDDYSFFNSFFNGALDRRDDLVLGVSLQYHETIVESDDVAIAPTRAPLILYMDPKGTYVVWTHDIVRHDMDENIMPRAALQNRSLSDGPGLAKRLYGILNHMARADLLESAGTIFEMISNSAEEGARLMMVPSETSETTISVREEP